MPMTLVEKANDFLSQQRIAVAGVSRQPNGTGNAIYKRLRERGYQVFAVNPNTSEAEGDICYPNLKAIPGNVDGVIIVTRPEAADLLVRECVEKGISRVWMHNGIHGAGSSVSESAVEFCKEHDIMVIAGACPLMFGKPSDGFHRFMKNVMRVTGGLPQ